MRSVSHTGSMMKADRDPVDAILSAYGIPGPWQPLRTTGIANRIYATRNVVVRIAADHPESVSDARTESVAAPVARSAGVLTPRLIAFDDSRTLVDRPFSLWERVRGETLGILSPDPHAMPNAWRAVGRQLALLHKRVDACPDPLGYLDQPGREMELETLLQELERSSRLDASTARMTRLWIEELRPMVDEPTKTCFVHNDLHDMNVMCTHDGLLSAIIDWGDAGWGDPVLEFAMVPTEAIPYVLDGYESAGTGLLGNAPEARIVWDKLFIAMDKIRTNPEHTLPLKQLQDFEHSRKQKSG